MEAKCCQPDQSQQCKIIPGSGFLPVLEKKGNITLGGLFSLHDMVVEPSLSFMSKPPPTQCTRFNFRTFRWMQTMRFAIEEINRDGKLLPNITLGYKIYDSCSSPHQALKAAMELMGSEKGAGDEEGETQGKSTCRGTVPAVIGDGGSTQSLVVARFLGVFYVPQVSYFSSCACLSNKTEFPAFLRTMPSDFFQVNALVQLVKHFGWTWVGVIAGDDAYGRGGANIFANEITKLGACVALHEIIPKNRAHAVISSVVSKIRSSGARVILVFAVEQDAAALFDQALRDGLTGIQWLASEAWSTAAILSTPKKYHHVLQGSMGFAIRRAHIPGLKEFLLRLHPSSPDALEDPFLKPFWEEVFQCSLHLQAEGQNHNVGSKPPCSGAEKLGNLTNIYSDVSQLRISYNVYKAVYAIAHSLKAMRSCVKEKGSVSLQACPDTDSTQPWQLLHYIKQVDYLNSFGDEIKFDKNGDPAAMYDLINWQLKNGEMEFFTVGKFDETATAAKQKLKIQEQDIVWNGNQTEVPMSVCSSICPPGTRKAIRPNFPICCHDCVVCTAGEISNQTDAVECVRCLPEFWSNVDRTACIPKQVEFLSFNDTMGIILMTISLIGSICTCVVVFIFSCHRTTPIVKANNSELSFLLLFSLALCFLCSLAFIGRPSEWSCMLRHTAFSITFVLCISCVLGKTIVVLMAFKATLPGRNVMKWFGPGQQKTIITICTLVQVIICTVWLAVAPPTPQQQMPHESAIIILLCDEGSPIAFGLVLGYIGLLACLCLLLAFLARKLPDNFNEARLITFSMLIFCAVWAAFVPAYLTSPGKYSIVTEVFAILASSYGLLGCIFAPKCYIILLRPEKNTRKHLMSKVVIDKF
ncbi:extracellular calcium-sensing receptor-like [Channa argus]|uniref:extracellular calcium-sensing receptor-like n=1 Tax=Channa argus TaxID=215402 RepID=UPI003520EA74